MADDRLKSAYELALERSKKKDADAGIVQTPITDEQKAAIAELRTRYQAKIAELEILHRGHMMSIVDPTAREAAENQYRRERERFNSERESKIEKVRRGE